jgi:activator of HSP90 ATPase
MSDVIAQSELFPAPADELFRMYLDPAEHAAITGAPVTISDKPGAEFSAFEGALSGRILAIVAPSLIVQSWRSTQFKPTDPDSTLILNFRADGNEGRIDLFHIDVPDHDHDGVTEGWHKFYWIPWRRYLAER